MEDHHFFSKAENTAALKKDAVETKAETPGEKDTEDVEDDFGEDEAQGDVVLPEELETFDEGKLHVVNVVEGVDDDD